MLPVLRVLLARLRAHGYSAGVVLFFLMPFVLLLLPSLEREANRMMITGGPPAGGWEEPFRVVWNEESKTWFHVFVGLFYVGMVYSWAIRRLRLRKSTREQARLRSRFEERNQAAGLAQRELGVFCKADPDFSRVAFLEFACTLWQETLLRLSGPSRDLLRPYFDAPTLEWIRMQFRTSEGRSCHDVLIHAVSLDRLFQTGPETGNGALHQAVVLLHASFEACQGERRLPRVYQSARLTFVRGAGVRSKPPLALFALTCQACGGALTQETLAEACAFCGVPFRNPLFNWVCVRCELLVEDRPDPIGAVRTSPEDLPGRLYPSVLSLSLTRDLRDLVSRDPGGLEHLARRLEAIFHRLHEGLDRNEVSGLQELLTERMFARAAFLAEGLRQAGLRRIHEGLRLESAEVVRLERDRWFDTVTVRLDAAARLHTRTARFGLLVAGSRRHEARFSVYWTLVRGAVPPAGAALSCPRCGVTLDREEVARCGHCGHRLQMILGDWELALTESPEDYIGDGVIQDPFELEEFAARRWLPVSSTPPPPPVPPPPSPVDGPG